MQNAAASLSPLSAPSYSYLSIGSFSDPVAQLWSRIQPALNTFKQLARQCDQAAIQQGDVPPELASQLCAAFAGMESLLDDELGDTSRESEATKQAVGERLQSEVLPYLLMSENGERWYSKPRGYAGDYKMIAHMYENQARGPGRIGPVLDRCFLNLAAVRAVQNRRALLMSQIHETLAASESGRARVMSLACGPAQELFDVYERLPDPGVLQSTLIDLDLQALAYVGDRRDQRRLRKQMNLLNENLIYLAMGRRQLSLPEQDFVYSIGLIDYFHDAMVIKLMNFAHSALRRGGRLILGNFHPRNVTKAVMEHILDWKLVHRTEADMDRLFLASNFRRPCTRILFEEQRINLFAECVKE